MDNPVTKTELTFLEKIVLLGLDDKGWFANSEHRIKYGMAGAILFELHLQGIIAIEDPLVRVLVPKKTEDPTENRVLSFMANGKKQRTLKSWIQRIVQKKLMIRKSVIKSLLDKKILKKEEYSLLWVMYQYKYPVINVEVKQELRQYLYDAIINRKALTDYDLMLISVMENCTMIRKNFRGFENYSKLRKNIREITQFDGAESGTLQVIRSLHVATNRAILASNVSIHA